MDKSNFHRGLGAELDKNVYMSLERRNYDPALMAGAVQSVTSSDITDGEIVNADIAAAAAIAFSKLAALTSAYIVVGNGSNVPTAVAVSGDATLANTGAITIAASAVTAAKTADSSSTGGLYVRKFGIAKYDFAVDGGTAGAITLASTCTIPDNAVVTAVNYDVITTCTSASDAATIKLTLPTDGDISTAIAISDGSNPWDAGAHAASAITPLVKKTTAARAVGITVAGGENLTAGKIIFGIEYFVTE